MSAYASLPGSFMPPFFAFGPSPEGAADGPSSGADAPPSTAGSPRTPSGPSGRPSSSGAAAPSISSILPPAFQDLSLSPLASRQESSPHPSDILIVIRSARVDPVELIRGLTSRGTRIARRTANFIARKPGRARERERERDRGEAADAEKKVDEASVFSGPDLCEDSEDSDDEYSMYDYSDDFSNPNDDDDDDDELLRGDPSTSDGDPSAIKFELSINFQGRKYNATRAYPKFVKLRNDLLRELSIAEGDNGRRGKRHLGGTKVGNSFMVDPKKEYAKGIPSSLSQNTNRKPEGGRSDRVTVPELPRVSPASLVHGGSALSGVARSGFSFLQATAQHYCPEMELWMKHVIAAFPCSQSLSQFLWEPLSSTNADCGTIGEGDECHGGGGSSGGGGGASSSADPTAARGARGKSKSPRVNRFMRGNTSRTRSGSTSTLESIEEGDGDDWDDDHST